MSLVGNVTGLPSAGFRMLFELSMRIRASAWASADSGTCTAIWSPSKSALYGVTNERVNLDGLSINRECGSKA